MTRTFADRIAYAVQGILRRENSREQDKCFEMYDGEAVAVAVFRRAERSPELARALCSQWSVAALDDHPWRKIAQEHAGADLPQLAARLRREGRERFARQQAEWAAAEQQRVTEPTEQGLQYVIPGCEKCNDIKSHQLDFWN